MKKKISYKPLLIIVYLVLAVAQVYLLNSLSTYGSELNKIEKNIQVLTHENDNLQEIIASQSSVTTLFKKAQTLGLITNPPSLSLNRPIPVAFGNTSAN